MIKHRKASNFEKRLTGKPIWIFNNLQCKYDVF